ncbi:hypothetical protein CBM2605_A60632 [Cupriavidus neocaledonicus]|uniref:Capsule synthesis protein CapA domain-containing protein n=1 Tax=Cupriavidus neocaledonicus TaxID=1040979 RepID=A0ABY1V3R6_9BURK|nr:hypothetical protein CBM2605_A60632 [Cupriavidus neocaledonicus]
MGPTPAVAARPIMEARRHGARAPCACTMEPASQPPLFLCGDVMTGRGIDQILAHPSQPLLHESYVHSALDYVRLAERKAGPIARPAGPDYPWGDALAELASRAARPRIVNLETAITTSDDAWPGKSVHYRMHPRNVDCLQAAGIDCAVLANNHVLDWGRAAGRYARCTGRRADRARRRGPRRGQRGRRSGAATARRWPRGGACLCHDQRRHAGGVARHRRALGREPAGRLVRGLAATHCRAGPSAAAPRRCDGAVDPLGPELGLPHRPRAARLRPRAGRARRHRHRARAFLASPARHRAACRQADPVRLRRFHQRLRGHRRIRCLPPGPGADGIRRVRSRRQRGAAPGAHAAQPLPAGTCARSRHGMAASHVRNTGTRAWHTRGAQRTARVAAMGGISRKPPPPRFRYLRYL